MSKISFLSPEWSSSKNAYTSKILYDTTLVYSEKRQSSGENFYSDPNIDKKEFINTIQTIAETIHVQGKTWFASPIKTVIFIKRVRHIFMKIPENYGNNYGNTVLLTWIPYVLEINPNYFELRWNVQAERSDNILPSNSIEYSDELNEPIIETTQIIQSNPAELDEIVETNEDLSNEFEISSRAIIKRKIRETRLKSTILALKAERMAEKYFRRYGMDTDFDCESDLSLDSDEEESDDQ